MRFRYSLRALLVVTLLAAVVLAGAVYWWTPRLEPDIKTRVRKDFPQAQHREVRRILLAYDPDSPRIHRCMLHVAAGGLNKLRKAARDARTDYRDVILRAEYEFSEKGWAEERVRDYSRPFDKAEKPPVDP